MKKLIAIIALAMAMAPTLVAQSPEYETLFEPLLSPAPEKCSVQTLESMPKFRCIHHDNFSRRNGSHVLGYPVMTSRKSKIDVLMGGVEENYIFDRSRGRKSQTEIYYLDTKRQNYGFMVKRGNGKSAAVAFRVMDVDNLYFVKADGAAAELYLVENGTMNLVKSIPTKGGNVFYFLIDNSDIYFYENYRYIGSAGIDRFGQSTVCGLYFSNKFDSEIQEFVVDYMDKFKDNNLESYVESNNIKNKKFAYAQAEDGTIMTSTKHRNGSSKNSLRFELTYYQDWANHKVASSRRTEIMPAAAESKPLDSWISSFDIYFPGKADGNEYYAADDLSELFWQSHDNKAADGLSPHVVFYLKNDVITFQTRARGELREDKKNIISNTDFGLDGTVAKLVDNISKGSSTLELKKGQWHNFTIYVKEGYSEAQLPRTIVYVDGKKVIDWSIPNAYNCEENAEYLKLGIYKWPWASDKVTSNVKKRVLYYDNIIYKR